MSDDLRRRVAAVERAVTGGETDVADIADAATLDARLDDAEARLEELAAQLRELDATTQALRGYLGGVDEVSSAVEQRADLALAKAETLERVVFEGDEDALAVERLPDPTTTAPRSGSDAAPPDGSADGPPDGRRGAEAPVAAGVSTADSSPPASRSASSDPAPHDDRSLVTRLRDVL